MRRAGFLGHHPPRDKEHHLASPKCRRESTPQPQSTRLSIRAVGGVDPVARSPHRPSSIVAPNRHITKMDNRRRRRRPHHRPRAGRAASAPPKPKCAAPDSSATTRQGIKNTISPARNVGERARRSPSQRGFRSGLLAASTPWLVFAPIARAPSSLRTGISLKWTIDGAAGGLTIGPSGSSSIAPPKPQRDALDSSATTRQGIKNTISPARNVGETRRSPSQRGFRSGLLAAFTPAPAPASIARAPSSLRTGISLKWTIDGAAGGLTIGPSGSSSIAPPKPKCAAPDSSATTRQGIKNTISPARNVGEDNAQPQSTRLSIRAVGGVDPVARSLRSPELHRRSEPAYH